MVESAFQHFKIRTLKEDQIEWFYRNFDSNSLKRGKQTLKSVWLKEDTWDGLYEIARTTAWEVNNASWRVDLASDRIENNLRINRHKARKKSFSWQTESTPDSLTMIILLQATESVCEIEFRENMPEVLSPGDGVIFQSSMEYRYSTVKTGFQDTLTILFPYGESYTTDNSESFFSQGGVMTPKGYDSNGNPIWLNVTLALEHIGHHMPKSVGISPPNQILEKAWNYWGPRIYFGRKDAMPTWDEMLEAQRNSILDTKKSEIIELLREEGERRITLNYTDGESEDFNEEWKIRLRNDATEAHHEERERLRGRYREVKKKITASKTEETLLSVDIKDDKLWEKPAGP